MKETCTTCGFLRTDPKGMVCIRFPPTLVIMRTPEGKPAAQGGFPPTMPEWVCGEHKPVIIVPR